MIAITQNAANQIHKMLAKNGLEGGGLRVGVKAGGCSGYEYSSRGKRNPARQTGCSRAPKAREFSSTRRAMPCSMGPSSTTTQAS